MSKTEWLNSLNVGDEVVYQPPGLSNYMRITSVIRLTKTLIILENDIRIRKSDGYMPGNNGWISQLTDNKKTLIKEHYEIIEIANTINNSDLIQLKTNNVNKIKDNKTVLMAIVDAISK